MRRHRVAVVGCGAIARGSHCPNVVANPRTELAVLCDIHPDAAEKCRQTFGAMRACADWREVVSAPDVDLIILATHTKLRSELILPSLQAGKPIFVEKPLAESMEEMRRIAAAAQSTGVPVCICHNRRSSPALLELKRLLDKAVSSRGGWLPSVDRSGTVGRPALPQERQLQILMRVNDDCRSWVDWIFDEPGGILFAEMVHFIDVALWLNPSPPMRVFAEGEPIGNFGLMIRFADGSLTSIHHTLAGHFDYPKELIEISTNHITLAMEHHVEVRQRGLVDEPFRRVFPIKGVETRGAGGIEGFHEAVTKAMEEARATASSPIFISPDKGHAAHLDRFLDCIEGRGPNPCDVPSAIRVTAVALRLLESARTGVPLSVDMEA